MSRSRRCLLALACGWLLLTPPYGGPPWSASMGVGCGDPGHMDECAPLSYWLRLGRFDDVVSCRRARDAGIAAARGDTELAAWQMARCFTDERVRHGPGLLPGE